MISFTFLQNFNDCLVLGLRPISSVQANLGILKLLEESTVDTYLELAFRRRCSQFKLYSNASQENG